MVFGSTAAAAAPVAVDEARASSPVGDAESVKLGSFFWILLVLVAVGFFGVIAGESEEVGISP